MTIEFYRKQVYGNTMLYIANDEKASIVRGLTGTKTVSEGDLKRLKELGCEIQEILNPEFQPIAH